MLSEQASCESCPGRKLASTDGQQEGFGRVFFMAPLQLDLPYFDNNFLMEKKKKVDIVRVQKKL